jgi:type IV pilus assembly protein PilW
MRGKRQGGMTLIEAMIAVTLGLLILAGVVGIFTGTSRSYREDAKSAHIHEDLSVAMAQISTDLEMAGHWAQRLNPSGIRVAPVGNMPAVIRECWKVPTVAPPGGETRYSYINSYVGNNRPLAFGDNYADPNDANTDFPCIAANDYSPGTDIVAIRRVIGAPTVHVDDGGVDPVDCGGNAQDKCNRVYLRANPNANDMTLFRPVSGAANPTGGLVVAARYDDWEYRVAVYYIRRCSVKGGADCAAAGSDNIPTLCRYVLQLENGNPAMVEECLAQGIEQLQLEAGLDTDIDGTPNFYTADVGDAAMNILQLRTVRVSLLARSVDLQTATNAPADTMLGANAVYKNQKTYTLAGGGANGYTATPDDSQYRKVATSVAVIRNWASLCVNFFGCGLI